MERIQGEMRLISEEKDGSRFVGDPSRFNRSLKARLEDGRDQDAKVVVFQHWQIHNDQLALEGL